MTGWQWVGASLLSSLAGLVAGLRSWEPLPQVLKVYAALRRVRAALAFYGIETDHLTDEELENRAAKFARAAREAETTTGDMLTAFSKLAKFMNCADGGSFATRLRQVCDRPERKRPENRA